MNDKSKEFLAKATELKDRAELVSNQQVRASLLTTAMRWVWLAWKVRRKEFGRSKPVDRKATVEALERAVRIYWENAKTEPVPDHLMQRAADIDEALANRAPPSIVPDSSVEAPATITQVKATSDGC